MSFFTLIVFTVVCSRQIDGAVSLCIAQGEVCNATSRIALENGCDQLRQPVVAHDAAETYLLEFN